MSINAVTENRVLVGGLPFDNFPDNLFIPPDALEVLLDSFSGPLDLLLYLIRKQQLDILDIPIALITKQYMQYIGYLEHHRLELAADYLVMAAMLAEIKSRLLLPVTSSDDPEEEPDPRLALARKLQLYEQFKQAAVDLDSIPRLERDHHAVRVMPIAIERSPELPVVSLLGLVGAMHNMLLQSAQFEGYQVIPERYSVKARMVQVLHLVTQKKLILFVHLLQRNQGRAGLVVTFLALLELAREGKIQINQQGYNEPIYLKLCL